MARPREGHVRSEYRDCRVHGRSEFRRHKHPNGHLWRCCRCLTESVQRAQARRRERESAAA